LSLVLSHIIFVCYQCVIVFEGYWRILDFQFLSLVLSHIIQLCDENEWIRAGIPYQECMQILEELFPRYYPS